MNHIVALASAQRLSADEARSALPDSPIRHVQQRSMALQRVNLTWRRFTGRFEPAPSSSGPALAHDRAGHYRREATTT